MVEYNHVKNILLDGNGRVLSDNTIKNLNNLLQQRFLYAKKYNESTGLNEKQKAIAYANILWTEETIKKLLNLE